MEPLLLLVIEGYILIGVGEVSLPVWGPEFWGGRYVSWRILWKCEGHEFVLD